MTLIQLREKLNDEIREIPDSRLQEIYARHFHAQGKEP